MEQGTDGRPVQYSQYMPVPYNLEVELSIISKNQDIVFRFWKILPTSTPHSMFIVIIETHEERDIAIVLNGVGLR